jgi:hypothetical protein
MLQGPVCSGFLRFSGATEDATEVQRLGKKLKN